MEKIEQVVRLIRSKGVGVYFITQSPKDVPDSVLAQLNNKIQHGLRAYTPAEQKAVKAAAQSYRENPAFDTFDTILALGTAEAVVSFLDEKGIPGIAQQVKILPPKSLMGGIDDTSRDNIIKGSILYTKYANAYDPDSAYEFFQRQGIEAAKRAEEEAAAEAKAKEEAELAKQKEKEEAALAKQQEKEEAALAKQKAKEEAALAKQQEKEAAAKSKKVSNAVNSVGKTVAGTVGRQVGKTLGSSFGSFGKTLGGNLGSALGRNLMGLFKK